MKLNKKERHFLYVVLLSEIEGIMKTEFHIDHYKYINGRDVGGMCDVLFFLLDTRSCENVMEEYGLKELISLKPKQPYSDTWWFAQAISGWSERVEVIKKCIRRTE